MIIQVWHDQPALREKGIEVSSLGFWVTSDTSRPLPQSFALLIVARVLGVQVGSVTIDPMKDGGFTMPLLNSVGGTVEGRIDGWEALDRNGHVVGAADTAWKTADAVQFVVTGVADVTLQADAISALVPGLGWLAKAALAVLGSKVKISVAHDKILAHLPHGSP